MALVRKRRLSEISVPLLSGLKFDQFPDDPENMLTSLLGWNKLFNAVTEQDHTDLVVVFYGRKRQYRGDLSDQVAFQLKLCPKGPRSTHIDQQHHGQFPLFLKNLYIGMAEPGSHIPVDAPDIITILVFTHFGEGHSPSLEGTVVFASKDLPGQPPGLDLNLPYLF